MTKQSYNHSSLNVVICIPFHVHDRIENILEHVSFYVHDFNIMAEEIGFPIRKLLENTSLYPIMGKTKTSKLLLTKLEIKHMSPYSDTTS
jgi:DNA modification methylase